jgi:hypothetical protein
MKRAILLCLGLCLLPPTMAQAETYVLSQPRAAAPGVALPVLPRTGAFSSSSYTDRELLDQAGSHSTIPLWRGGVVDGAKTYDYTMVGGDPHSSNGSTTVDIVIVPLEIQVGSSIFSPWKADRCTGNVSPVNRVLKSPMIDSFALTAHGTRIGTGTYIDQYQRASFWKYVKPGGRNPNFHNRFRVSIIDEHILVRIANGGSIHSAPCGEYAEIDLETFDPFVQSTIFPNHTAALAPTKLVVFVLHNVIMDYDNQTRCCYYGYHQAFDNSSYDNAFQTYVMTDYDTTGKFGNIADTITLSHEMAEWLADPSTHNPTPAWGSRGDCQKILEVADPLEDTSYTIDINNFKYHVQDLAFISWYFNQKPSIGLAGLYSLYGNFTKPSTLCK